MSGSGQPGGLARLDVFVGEWTVEAVFPDGPTPAPGTGTDLRVRTVFEWLLGGAFLMQRTEIPLPGPPDSVAIVSACPDADAYTQHYYDSRGVARLYAMTFTGGVWRLMRDAPDFSPLSFRQRFTGTFSDDGNIIRGAWEKSFDGSTWAHDFGLTYRRAG